jgi:hypothetical protein
LRIYGALTDDVDRVANVLNPGEVRWDGDSTRSVTAYITPLSDLTADSQRSLPPLSPWA